MQICVRGGSARRVSDDARKSGRANSIVRSRIHLAGVIDRSLRWRRRDRGMTGYGPGYGPFARPYFPAVLLVNSYNYSSSLWLFHYRATSRRSPGLFLPPSHPLRVGAGLGSRRVRPGAVQRHPRQQDRSASIRLFVSERTFVSRRLTLNGP